MLPKRPGLERVKDLLRSLPSEDLEELHAYVGVLIAPAATERVALEARPRRAPAITVRKEFVRCGKPGCRCQSEGPIHGPYVYHYFRVEGALKKVYVGRPGKPKRVAGRNAQA